MSSLPHDWQRWKNRYFHSTYLQYWDVNISTSILNDVEIATFSSSSLEVIYPLSFQLMSFSECTSQDQTGTFAESFIYLSFYLSFYPPVVSAEISTSAFCLWIWPLRWAIMLLRIKGFQLKFWNLKESMVSLWVLRNILFYFMFFFNDTLRLKPC